MSNTEKLRRAFDRERTRQAKLHGRPVTPLSKAAGAVVFAAAMKAIEDVTQDRREVVMRTVSLGTGTGKSTAAHAFIAAAAKQDEKFSAAYVVPTVELAIEAQEGIEALLGEGSTLLWSWCHQANNRQLEKIEAALGYVPERTCNQNELRHARVVIVTHKLWQREMRDGLDVGVRRYYGERRSVVFVDEHPGSLVEIIETRPAELLALHDDMATHDATLPDEAAERAYGSDVLSVLSAVGARMAAMMQSTGQTYATAELVTAEEVSKLAKVAKERDLLALTDDGEHIEMRQTRARNMFTVLRFLRAAARGCVFYSRHECAFYAYRLDFEPEPGHVLLDATADITGLVALHPGVEAVEVPQVDYAPLEIVQIEHPRKFRNVSRTADTADGGRAYGAWIKAALLANTEPGDDVLILVHKKMVDHRYIEHSDDPGRPLDWEGRKVNTQTYGSGEGLNKWKHKTVVFQAGDWYPQRSALVSTVHAWQRKPTDNATLKLAEGRRIAADEFAPRGVYLKPHDGHMLRTTKQMSTRGNSRNVDELGRCGRQKFLTSGDKRRLLLNLHRLFPGASLPKRGVNPEGYEGQSKRKQGSGRAGLVSMLERREFSVIGADVVERETGIKTCDLSREFAQPTVAPVATAYGWRLVAAKEIGKAGRMRYLVNDAMLHAERAAQVPQSRTAGKHWAKPEAPRTAESYGITPTAENGPL